MKNRISVIIFIIAGGIFMFSDAIAQSGQGSGDGFRQGRGPGQGMMQERGVMHERILSELDLTQEQRLEIAEIMARHRAENRLERGNRDRSRRNMVAPPRDEIMEVLTPEQRASFDEMRTERQNVRRQYSETYSQALIEGTAEKLELDSEKKAQILELNTRHRESMQAIRDAGISGEINRNELRNKTDELRLNHRKAMQEILTEDEYAQWQNEMRGNRPGWNDGRRSGPSDRGNRPERRGNQRGNN